MIWKGGKWLKFLSLLVGVSFSASARLLPSEASTQTPRYRLAPPLLEGNRALQNLHFALSVLPQLTNRCLDNPVCVGSSEATLLELKKGLANFQIRFIAHTELNHGFCALYREAYYSDSGWDSPIDVCLPKLEDPMTGLPRWSLQETVVEIAELMLLKATPDDSGKQSQLATHLAELTGYRFIERWNHQAGFEHLRTLTLELPEDSQLFRIFVSSKKALWDLTPEFRSMPLCGEALKPRTIDFFGARWLFGRFSSDSHGIASGSVNIVADCVSPEGAAERREMMGFWNVDFDLIQNYEISYVKVAADFSQVSPGIDP
jgi:hypothetical protein